MLLFGNDREVNIGKFPDGTMLIKMRPEMAYGFWPLAFPTNISRATITWLYENDAELVALIHVTKHLRRNGITNICLKMPYIPNARQDRVKSEEDVFTLKSFVEVINWLDFTSVEVLDPHSSVSEALIDRIKIRTPKKLVENVIDKLKSASSEDDLMMFYPDEGAMKRYSSMFNMPYAFGIKKRDWSTGKINGLDVSGMTDMIAGKRILIVDDICSRGGTFYHSAKKLKELGAKEIYLYVSHCENTILDGELLTSGLVDRVFTTNSIFTKEHEKIEVMNYDAD